MAEEKRKPRWADEEIIGRDPEDDIACKDCVYRLPEITLPSGKTAVQYKKAMCEVFKHNKPNDVLWKKAECPFYEKDERGEEIDNLMKELGID